jgi:hypothetical protein
VRHHPPLMLLLHSHLHALLRHGSNGRRTGGLRGLGLGSGFSSDDTDGDAVTSKV